MSRPKKDDDVPDTPSIRPDVLALARRAAMMTYVHAKDRLRLDEMATSLDAGVTPAMLDKWREEDRWEEHRAEAIGAEALALSSAEHRSIEARLAVERIHNRAWNAQRALRPKSWESAVSLQLRAAETLRSWADEDVRRWKPDAGQDADSGSPVPPTPVEELTEEEWQQMAHAALSKKHTPEKIDDN